MRMRFVTRALGIALLGVAMPIGTAFGQHDDASSDRPSEVLKAFLRSYLNLGPSTPVETISGTYSFAQLIKKDTTTYTFGKDGTFSCPTTPGLDAQYPYPLFDPDNNRTWDYPGVPLEQVESRISRTFKANMYLLWTSSKKGSIPVPIGSQSWTIDKARTTNTGYPTSQSWTQPVWNALGTDGDPVNYVDTAPSQSPYGYPTWTGPAKAVANAHCPIDSTQEEEQ